MTMNQKILFSHDKKRAVNISEHGHGWTGRLYVNCNPLVGNGLGDATLQIRHANKLETIKRWALGVFKQ